VLEAVLDAALDAVLDAVLDPELDPWLDSLLELLLAPESSLPARPSATVRSCPASFVGGETAPSDGS
jgi:hypothetical protein